MSARDLFTVRTQENAFHRPVLGLKPFPVSCPLCHGVAASFTEDKHRSYWKCERCSLIFVPAEYHLTPEEEKAQYDLHENDSNDPAYRKFLSRLAEPLLGKLSPNSCGLDFGCGPGPTLSVMLEEAGHQVALHDPFYKPNPGALEASYDFISATEVLEHLRQPRRELDALWDCLRPEGWLGVMTKRATDQKAFNQWHYKQDPTHICFWSRETFQWLAGHWGVNLELIEPDVALIQK